VIGSLTLVERIAVDEMQADMKSRCRGQVVPEHTRTSVLGQEAAVDIGDLGFAVEFLAENAAE
jgi:hypothetical protein